MIQDSDRLIPITPSRPALFNRAGRTMDCRSCVFKACLEGWRHCEFLHTDDQLLLYRTCPGDWIGQVTFGSSGRRILGPKGFVDDSQDNKNKRLWLTVAFPKVYRTEHWRHS